MLVSSHDEHEVNNLSQMENDDNTGVISQGTSRGKALSPVGFYEATKL
jgi:hypothetical protein